MNSNFALIDGNLALSDSHTDSLTACYAYETEILTFPAPPHSCTQSTMPLYMSSRTVQPSRVQALHGARRLFSNVAFAVVTVGMIAVVLAALFTVLGSEARTFDRALVETERTTVSVDPGDTLWDIAEEHGVDGLTTQQSVDLIRTWNDLEQSALQPGMELLVPALN